MGSVASNAAAASSGGSTFIIFIIIIIGAMYFLVMRPGRKRQQRVQQQQSSVQPGARVRTTAGMYATVVAVDGDDVILEVAPDVEVRYMKRAIMEVIGDTGMVDDETDETGEDGIGEDDETADHDEHIENEEHEEHEEAAVPAGTYGDDLTINGKPDKAKSNGDHETVTPESTAAKD
jgi:preprotein translocase subunit YajC